MIYCKIFFSLLMGGFTIFGGQLLLAQQNLEYTTQDPRDPFEEQLPKPEQPKKEPPEVEEPLIIPELPKKVINPPDITIESMISGGPKPRVIIKGRMLGVGEEVEGARITNITREGAEVVYEGEKFIIPAPSKAIGTANIKENILGGGQNEIK